MKQTTIKEENFLEEVTKLINELRMTVKEARILREDHKEVKALLQRIEAKIDTPIYTGTEKVTYNGSNS